MAIIHMRKLLGGELSRFNKVDDFLTHALRSMLALKVIFSTLEIYCDDSSLFWFTFYFQHSMQLFLADTGANDNNPDARIETNLLPTVSYITIYKEAVNDEVAGSNS